MAAFGFSDLLDQQSYPPPQGQPQPDLGPQVKLPTQPQAQFPQAQKPGFFGSLINALAQGGASGGRYNIGPALSFLLSPTSRQGQQAAMQTGAQEQMTGLGQQQAIAKQYSSDPNSPIHDVIESTAKALRGVGEAQAQGIQNAEAHAHLSQMLVANADYLATHGTHAASQMLENQVKQSGAEAALTGGQAKLTGTKAGEEEMGAKKYGGVAPEVGLQEKAQTIQSEQFTASQKQQMDEYLKSLTEEQRHNTLSAISGYTGIGSMMDPEVQKMVKSALAGGLGQEMTGPATPPGVTTAKQIHGELSKGTTASTPRSPEMGRFEDALVNPRSTSAPQSPQSSIWGNSPVNRPPTMGNSSPSLQEMLRLSAPYRPQENMFGSVPLDANYATETLKRALMSAQTPEELASVKAMIQQLLQQGGK